MTTIATISELLTQSGSQYRIYDLGRKIDKLTKQIFLKIEKQQLAYPFPVQGHAQFAVVFWQTPINEPYLWFIKLPLDERGLLNQGARNHFIAIIIEALGAQLTNKLSKTQTERLKENPYHFTPSQYKLAALNSLVKVELKQAPSKYYQQAQQYIYGKIAWQQWQDIAIQGLTDVAARLNEGLPQAITNAEAISQNINNYDENVLLPLCCALENQQLPINLLNSIINLFEQGANSALQQQYLIRALASSCEHSVVIKFIEKLLTTTVLDEDLFIAISARCWLALQQPQHLMLFLEKLVATNNNELFSAIFKDLVAIPVIRPVLFQCMRDPSRSKALAAAIGQLFNQLGA